MIACMKRKIAGILFVLAFLTLAAASATFAGMQNGAGPTAGPSVDAGDLRVDPESGANDPADYARIIVHLPSSHAGEMIEYK